MNYQQQNYQQQPQQPRLAPGQVPQGLKGASDPSDLTLPYYGATFGQAITRFFRNYVNFNGRASREEFLWPMVVLCGPIILLHLIATIIQIAELSNPQAVINRLDGGVSVGQVITWILVVPALATLLPAIAVTIRRMHDTNRPGTYVLFGLIPVAGYALLLYFGNLPSDPAGVVYDQKPGQYPGQPGYGAPQGQPQYGAQPGQQQYGAPQNQPQYGASQGYQSQPQYGAPQAPQGQQNGASQAPQQYGAQPGQPQYGYGAPQSQSQYGYGAPQGQPQHGVQQDSQQHGASQSQTPAQPTSQNHQTPPAPPAP